MSIVHSISVDSSSSTATMTTIPGTDLVNNSSNGLYEDRDHFQAIFSNDSRFFDTSLHLFKSYCSLGYIQSNDEKHNKLQVPVLTTTSDGHKHRWRPRLLGLGHNHNSNNNNNNNNGVLKAFLTPTSLRKNDYSSNIRSDSGASTNGPINYHQKSQMVVQYQRALVPTINISADDRSDEPEITITRL